MDCILKQSSKSSYHIHTWLFRQMYYLVWKKNLFHVVWMKKKAKYSNNIYFHFTTTSFPFLSNLLFSIRQVPNSIVYKPIRKILPYTIIREYQLMVILLRLNFTTPSKTKINTPQYTQEALLVMWTWWNQEVFKHNICPTTYKLVYVGVLRI